MKKETKSKLIRLTSVNILGLATCGVLVRDSYSTTRPKIKALSYGNFGDSVDDYWPKNCWCYSVQTTIVLGGGCFYFITIYIFTSTALILENKNAR